MQTFLLSAHAGWRWMVGVAVLAAIGYGVWGWLTNQPWNDRARKLMLYTTIAIDIQVLGGLALYVARESWSQLNPSQVRFEHPTLMLIVLGLTHMLHANVKRGKNPAACYRAMAIGMIGVGIIIVVGILRLPGHRLFPMS